MSRRSEGEVVKTLGNRPEIMKELLGVWLDARLAEAKKVGGEDATLVLAFDSDGTLFPHTWTEDQDFIDENAQYSNFDFFKQLQDIIKEKGLKEKVYTPIVSNQWSSKEKDKSGSSKVGLDDVYKEKFPQLPLIGREVTRAIAGASKGNALKKYLEGIGVENSVVAYFDDDRNTSYEDAFGKERVLDSSMYGTRAEGEDRGRSCMTTWEAKVVREGNFEASLGNAKRGSEYGFCPTSVVLSMIQNGEGHLISQDIIEAFGCNDLQELSEKASGSMGVEAPKKELVAKAMLTRANVASSYVPPIPERGSGYERLRATSMIPPQVSDAAVAAAAPTSPASGEGRRLPPTPPQPREVQSSRVSLRRRTPSYEMDPSAPPIPERGSGYERLRADPMMSSSVGPVSPDASRDPAAVTKTVRKLPTPPKVPGEPALIRRRVEDKTGIEAAAPETDGRPGIEAYFTRRGMMPSPDEQEGAAVSQISRIGMVKASLEGSIDKFSHGYTASELLNPRISGFANFLDYLVGTGKHNEAILLIVQYGDQYLIPKQERAEGSPGRDFKDTKQFLKSSSDFIKSPAGIAALDKMLKEGLEFKDVMKAFASLKHVSNELNNIYPEETSQRKGTIGKAVGAVGRLFSVSKRPPAAEASASGEQINFDCCETEIFTGFLSQLIERAEPANLLSLVETLGAASEASKSRLGDNSLFGANDAIVLKKPIDAYTKKVAPSRRPATFNVGDPSAAGSQTATQRSTPR